MNKLLLDLLSIPQNVIMDMYNLLIYLWNGATYELCEFKSCDLQAQHLRDPRGVDRERQSGALQNQFGKVTGSKF